MTPKQANPLPEKIDIAFQTFVLDNGLTLIVHEDRKAPIVAVNIWYHVGSKNEQPDRTGLAHLFEHLMFNGSEHYNDDFFKPMQRIGATDLNGTTNEDRTNYFENIPVQAMDLALWLESDRMGHLRGAIDQAKLDEQRGVVQNEKRQSDNEPYGMVEELIARGVFPSGHPYSWTVIGSLADLDAATLDDVHRWFARYYGPNNAVMAIAGDVDAKAALDRVRHFFGDIPAGPPLARHHAWIARRSGAQRQSVQDRVPQARIYKIWNIPPWGSIEANWLDLASDVLADGRTSRFYRRLVYDEQLATSVNAYVDLREIAGLFIIEADARPGVELARVEKALDEELARFSADGPTIPEMIRVKTQYLGRFIRGCERIGGFGGKSDVLARSQVFAGRPDFYQTILSHIEAASAAELQRASAEWLSDGVYALEVHPYPEFSVLSSRADRHRMPEPGPEAAVEFPPLQRARLANGLQIALAERHSIPVVRFNLLLDAGFAADQFAAPGTATMAMDMLDEGTERRSSLQISEQLLLLGAQLSAGSNLDLSFVSLSALKNRLDEALAIFADIVLNPVFPETDFRRLQKLQRDRIQREKSTPMSMALRVFPRLIYGPGHAYANPFTGSGYDGSVAGLRREDLVCFHRTWFKPNHSTLLVVGDTTLSEIMPILEKFFQDWPAGEIPVKNIAAVERTATPALFLIDKPDAPQSLVIAGHVAPPSSDPDNIAIETMNFILGGDFVSRLNMNLRERKHWSYGAGSFLVGARGQRPFIVFAPVQSDKTGETMNEIRTELTAILGDRPINAEEFTNARESQALQLPGQWETMAAIESALVDVIQYGLADDYYQRYAGLIRQLVIAEVVRAAQRTLQPQSLQWVVVGDRAKIEAGIGELGIGPPCILDGDGNPLR